MALTPHQRTGIAETRILAKASDRAELVDALSLVNSPTVEGSSPAELAAVDISTLHAAAFGTLSAMAEELCATVEALAAELDRPRDCAGAWALWRVDEGTGMARELGHLDREAAEAMAAQLNRDRKRPVHFMALPLGGEPFDTPDETRNPWHLAQAGGGHDGY